MATSAYHWHEYLASSMEGIEEGLLDETDQPTTFPTITEHHWKEVVCDPSKKSSPTAITAKKDREHSINVEGDENIRIDDSMLVGQYESYVTLPVVSNVAEKDSVESEELKKPGCLIKSGFEDSSFCTILKHDFGPQPLSYSIKESIPNDEQSLYALSNPNVRPGSAPARQNGVSSRLMTGIDRLPTSSLEKASESTGRPRSVPLLVSPGVDWKSLIKVEKSSQPISNANIWETEQLMPQSTTSAKEAVEMQKQKYEDESNILVVSEDHLDVSNSRNSYNALTSIEWKDGKKKTLAFQVKPAFSKNSQLSEQPSSSPIGYSAPPLQDTRFIKSLSSSSRFLAEKGGTDDEFGQPKTAPIIDDLESPLELRKISGADEEVLLNAVPFSKTTLKRDNFSRFTTRNSTNELRAEKELIPFEGFSHISGDGKHEIESDRNIIENFDPLYEVKQRKTGDTEQALKVGSTHSDSEHVGIPQDEKDPNLLLDTRLEFMSSELQTASLLTSQPSEVESQIATLNVSTSRKAAENLPVRPLTIGDSLTIASTTAYRPISPFQPNIDAVASAPMVPPDTNITTMAYSEGPLDADEEIGDMSARERLQPLGRDGLEVKQGPPWGITMPLFQPDSRNSSLSSNNSSTSGMQFTKLQMSLSEQTKVETEPLQSRSSTPSETGLSRKASVRSLEPKEPMAVKLMPNGGDVRTPIAKFRQHDVVDVDSPVSKILGPTFKATQHMLEELQRRPLGAYVEDLEQYTTNTENERNIRQRRAYTDKKLLLTNSDDGQGTEAHHASNLMEGRKHSQTRDGNNSDELVNKTPGNSYHEPSTIQFGPNVLPVTSDNSKSEENINEVNQIDPDVMPVTHDNFADVSSVQFSNTTIEKPTELMSSRAMLKGFPINQHTADLKHFTPDIPGVVNNATSVISERGIFQRDVDKAPGDVTTGLKTTGVTQEFSRSQQATVSSVPHMGSTTPKVVNENGVQLVQNNRPSSSGKSLSASTRSSFSEGLLTRSTLSSSLTIMADSLSQACDPAIEAVHSQKNESPKIRQTSSISDSTLGNSIALPGDLAQTQVKENKEGLGGLRRLQSENAVLTNARENVKDASNLSEFDRVASASISWSNAVANQFREEIKSVDLNAQEGFLEFKDRRSLVNQPAVATTFLDSGLSESSTNDDIYRPKRLSRLSVGNEPVGIYDIRHSSSPGSTNRKRIAIGKKPRESLKSLRVGNIYVSDATIGTSGTEKDSQGRSDGSRDRINEDVYVSDRTTNSAIQDTQRKSRHIRSKVHANYVFEGTKSGTDHVHNGINRGPDGQSAPNSWDISPTQRSTLTTTDPKESCKKMRDIRMEFEKPLRASKYEINKLTQQSASSVTSFNTYRRDASAYPTFKIDKPAKRNASGSSKDGTLTKGNSNLDSKINHGGQKVSNVSRLPSAAKVEHTWSISKPVMSQLNTGSTPLMINDGYLGATSTTVRQTTSQQYKQHRNPKKRQTRDSKDESSESSESQKIRGKSAPVERKKCVADIILENMIQEEQEQKKRQKKLEVRQERTSKDLNNLWDRFQEVFGKKTRSSHCNKTNRLIPSTYAPTIRSFDPVVPSKSPGDTTPDDMPPTPNSDFPSRESSVVGKRSVDITTDSDEEFERFLHRIRELQSSDSSYHGDNSSTSSRPSSGQPAVNAPTKRTQPNVGSSTSTTSIDSENRRRARRNASQMLSDELLTRKGTPQNDMDQILTLKPVNRKYESPVSLPMWLNVKNMEIINQGKTSTSCTCGAKSRKELPRTTHGFRDVGVNCPTPPAHGAQTPVVAADIAALKAGSSQENIPHHASASTVKLTLQNAFMYSKQEFIDRSRERVKKLKQKCEERKQVKTSSQAQVVVVVPNEKTKPQGKKGKNPDERMFDVMKPSKKFEQLTRKKPRPMSNKEIRDVNKRAYKNLPEVRKKKADEKRSEFYKTNRLRAQLYGKGQFFEITQFIRFPACPQYKSDIHRGLGSGSRVFTIGQWI